MRWIRRQCEEFALPSFVLNGRRVIRRSDLIAWVEVWEHAEESRRAVR